MLLNILPQFLLQNLFSYFPPLKPSCVFWSEKYSNYLVCLVLWLSGKDSAFLPAALPFAACTFAVPTLFWLCIFLPTQGLFLALAIPVAYKALTLTLVNVSAVLRAQFICHFFSDFLITTSPDQEMCSF